MITVDRWLDKPAMVGKQGALMLNSAIPPKGRIMYENKVEQCIKNFGYGEKYQLRAKFKAEKVLHGNTLKQRNTPIESLSLGMSPAIVLPGRSWVDGLSRRILPVGRTYR